MESSCLTYPSSAGPMLGAAGFGQFNGKGFCDSMLHGRIHVQVKMRRE